MRRMLGLMGLVVLSAASFADMQATPWAAYADFLLFVQTMGDKILVLTGCALFVGSLVQYVQHRKNPASVRLSKPISLLIMGALLIGLSFVPIAINQGGY